MSCSFWALCFEQRVALCWTCRLDICHNYDQHKVGYQGILETHLRYGSTAAQLQIWHCSGSCLWARQCSLPKSSSLRCSLFHWCSGQHTFRSCRQESGVKDCRDWTKGSMKSLASWHDNCLYKGYMPKRNHHTIVHQIQSSRGTKAGCCIKFCKATILYLWRCISCRPSNSPWFCTEAVKQSRQGIYRFCLLNRVSSCQTPSLSQPRCRACKFRHKIHRTSCCRPSLALWGILTRDWWQHRTIAYISEAAVNNAGVHPTLWIQDAFSKLSKPLFPSFQGSFPFLEGQETLTKARALKLTCRCVCQQGRWVPWRPLPWQH